MKPRIEDLGDHARTIVRAVLEAVDARRLVAAGLGAHPARARRPAVMAIGKAAGRMMEGWVGAMGEPSARLVVVPRGAPAWPGALEGEHPIPGAGSEAAGAAVETFIRDVKAADSCDGFVLLLSGGASAIVTAPVWPLTLADVAGVTRELLRSGAPIGEFNRVRRHIDRLKGGRMAALAAPLSVDAYMISDVPGEDVSALGSGPVVPDGSTYGGALEVMHRYGVESPVVRRFLEAGERGAHPETPKHGDPVFEHVRCVVIGDNGLAVEAAARCVEGLGFAEVEEGSLAGDASAAGVLLARSCGKHAGDRPRAWVWGGETTVRVSSAAGVGGRNQELALAAAMELDGDSSRAVIAFGTDGVDGPTDAAGAVVTGATCGWARGLGLDAAGALGRHDSHGFFGALERAGRSHLIRTGPTGTNVNDVAVALAY